MIASKGGIFPIFLPHSMANDHTLSLTAPFNTSWHFGSDFIERSEMIHDKDQVRLDSEINKIRSELKVKVNQLREKEGREELQGFDLQALTKEEMNGIKHVLGLK